MKYEQIPPLHNIYSEISSDCYSCISNPKFS